MVNVQILHACRRKVLFCVFFTLIKFLATLPYQFDVFHVKNLIFLQAGTDICTVYNVHVNCRKKNKYILFYSIINSIKYVHTYLLIMRWGSRKLKLLDVR